MYGRIKPVRASVLKKMYVSEKGQDKARIHSAACEEIKAFMMILVLPIDT